jgi:hypothetical protein
MPTRREQRKRAVTCSEHEPYAKERILMSHRNQPGFVELGLKTVIVHTITYMLVGATAFFVFDYAEAFAAPELACWMRQTDDPLVMAGPLFQPIRGLIFALAFFPLRETLFAKKNGWLITWWLLIALGILSTFGPAPGSVEGMIYTILPLSITTYPEVVVQAFLLSAVLYYWINNPHKRWLNWVLGLVFVILMLLTILGLITAYGF